LDDNVLQIVEPLFCADGWRLDAERYSSNRGGTSVDFYCVRGDEREDANMRFLLFVLGVIGVPVVMLIVSLAGGRGNKRKNVMQPQSQTYVHNFSDGSGQMQVSVMQLDPSQVSSLDTSPIEMTPDGVKVNFGGTPMVVQHGDNLTLTERLRQLQEAYDAGLLTREEFEKTRQQILSDHAEN
jgi:hypothetical protein